MTNYKIPIGTWVESIQQWLVTYFEIIFNAILQTVSWTVASFEHLLAFSRFETSVVIILMLFITFIRWKTDRSWLGMALISCGLLIAMLAVSMLPTISAALLLTILLSYISYKIGSVRAAIFTAAGLLLILNLGYWDQTMKTLALVLTAAIISIVFGIPLGIMCARNNTVNHLLKPVLDFMQTMPAFVYLIPAVTFFGLGTVPGVIASVIFAIPPTIRLTNLGIRQVPEQLAEAADAFGSTSYQKLLKLQLPLAVPTIMAGINQTIMLSLSMVVIASMIGAQGIGADVLRAVGQLKTGTGFEAGLAIVILAIILDRLTQSLVKKKERIN